MKSIVKAISYICKTIAKINHYYVLRFLPNLIFVSLLLQAVYHNVKPAVLQQQLEAVHLSPEKAEMFSQTWATAGPELVEKLKQNIFAPKKVRLI